MPNLLVRGVSEEVHTALQRRAEQQGQSLQRYLSEQLQRLAEKPTLEEVLDRIDGRRGGRIGLTQASEDIAEERSRR